MADLVEGLGLVLPGTANLRGVARLGYWTLVYQVIVRSSRWRRESANARHHAVRRRLGGRPYANPRGARRLPARQRCVRLASPESDLGRRSHKCFLQNEWQHVRRARAVESAIALIRADKRKPMTGA